MCWPMCTPWFALLMSSVERSEMCFQNPDPIPTAWNILFIYEQKLSVRLCLYRLTKKLQRTFDIISSNCWLKFYRMYGYPLRLQIIDSICIHISWRNKYPTIQELCNKLNSKQWCCASWTSQYQWYQKLRRDLPGWPHNIFTFVFCGTVYADISRIVWWFSSILHHIGYPTVHSDCN